MSHLPLAAPKSAVCIVSGGMDSICYASLLGEKYDIYMITFAYGQRAKREIHCAKSFSRVLGATEHRVVDIGFMKSLYGSSNALTDSTQNMPPSFAHNLVVPIRNAVFITIASAWALSIDASVVAYGAHTGDISAYPDCRPEFAKSLSSSLNLAQSGKDGKGMQKIIIKSPAIDGMDKSMLLRAGHRLLGDRIFQTWSCYTEGIKVGSRHLHCGRCESCINRKAALLVAGLEDKTRYAENVAGRKTGKVKRDIYQH